jgi:MFS family permease
MVGGIIADIYMPKNRNTPMALFSVAAIFGTGLGPLVCGFIAEYTTWRWIFYIQIIIAGMITLAVIFLFGETRGLVILRTKAKKLDEWYDILEAGGCYGVRFPTEEKSVIESDGGLLEMRSEPVFRKCYGHQRRVRFICHSPNQSSSSSRCGPHLAGPSYTSTCR